MFVYGPWIDGDCKAGTGDAITDDPAYIGSLEILE